MFRCFFALNIAVVFHAMAASENINIKAIIDTEPEGGDAGIGHDADFDALKFLERTGYLDDPDPVKGRQHSPDNVKQALKEYQTFFKLSVTGRLDKATVAKMKKPRCGVPDVIKPSLRPGHSKNSTAPLPYTLQGKWFKNLITYKFGSYTKQLGEQAQRETIALALSRWADVTPLKFKYVSGSEEADIVIEFGKRDHGDEFPFDGRSGVLAHSFYPGKKPTSGDVHFDDDEHWTLNTFTGQNLFQTAVHELGHALGMGHSNVEWVIMYPMEWGYIHPPPYLYQDDIQGIQDLYGPNPDGSTPRVQQPVPPDPDSPDSTSVIVPFTAEPTPSVTYPYCNVRFDAIEQVGDGSIFAFVGDDLYSVNGHTDLYNKVGKIFRGGPSVTKAVVYDRVNKHTYFFKGSQYWRFTNEHKDEGYPKILPADFHNIDAAMQGEDNIIYIFQGGNIARWTEGMTSYSRGYPRTIGSYFAHGPAGVDAAFFVPANGYTYIFKDQQYWRYTGTGRRVALSPDFPKDMRPFWLSCGIPNDEDTESFAG